MRRLSARAQTVPTPPRCSHEALTARGGGGRLEAAWRYNGARGASWRQQRWERGAARPAAGLVFNRTRGGWRSERAGGREEARRAGTLRNVPPYIDLDLRRVLLACPLACLCPGLTHAATDSNIGLAAATVQPSSLLLHDAISSIPAEAEVPPCPLPHNRTGGRQTSVGWKDISKPSQASHETPLTLPSS